MDIGDIKYLEAPAKITKLSEAIRIGAKLRGQCMGVFGELDGSTCAMGAAYHAMTGHEPSKGVSASWLEPWLRIQMTYAQTYGHSIYADNDRGMTREQIADRIEAIGF